MNYGSDGRYNRSRDAKIRLITCEVKSNTLFTCLVQGLTSSYVVEYETKYVCTCPDFMRRKKPCKHIYFIFCRYLGQSKNNVDSNLILFSDIKIIIEQKQNIPVIGECPVCFDDITVGDVETCRNGHSCCGPCIRVWRNTTAGIATCPLCRASI